MPAARVSMRKIKEMLRLRSVAHLSQRQIAAALRVSRSTVAEYFLRLEAAGLSWPLPDEIDGEQLDEERLERLLFPTPVPSTVKRPPIDFEHLHRELSRPGVTLMLLWQEYHHQHPDGYRYSQFCELYRRWRQELDVVMRQHHTPGEKLFVDYAGMTMSVVEAATGEIRTAQIFVAALGASSYTYAEATLTQTLPDFIASHVRCFAFLGGVPRIIVPDNLKSGVTRADRYDPVLNPAYAAMADHYCTAILPARARKPRDKAKVEVAVQVVERWVLARLRDRTFFSLGELNDAIRPLVAELNERRLAKLERSRRELFEELDRPALGSPPENAYQRADWKQATVNVDYHIEVAGHYYSVPYTFVRKRVDVRITERAVEVFSRGERIASHMRDARKGRYTILSEHMPERHRQHAECTPAFITQWAASIGAATAELVETIIASRAHPQQGYRICLGILRLSKRNGIERLEAACRHALAIGARTVSSVDSILKHGIDQRASLMHDTSMHEQAPSSIPRHHENIRGADYYRHTIEDNPMDDNPTPDTTVETSPC